MSIKLEIKGIINHTSEPKAIKSGYVQELVITKPAGQDQFGDKIGKDNHYRVALFRPTVADFPYKRSELLKAKVKATAYLNGNEFATQNGLAYSLNLTVKDLEIIK